CILNPQAATYEATIATSRQYVRCMATATVYKNFAYQVALNIYGDAGGLIFRFDDKIGAFYRFSVSSNAITPNSYEYGVYQCTAEQKCASTNYIADGTRLAGDSVQVDPKAPVNLAVIA